jgi:hypothetical protein
VIVDATFPHKIFNKATNKSDRFICTIKVIDASQFLDPKTGIIEHCTIVIFADTFEDLPICQKIGDIIRVHRSNIGQFKGVKQFNMNMFFKSAWALFSGSDPTMKPYAFSGKNITLE